MRVPYQFNSSDETISAAGTAGSPEIPPGTSGKLHLNLPENFPQSLGAAGEYFLSLRVTDPTGRELWTYVWPFGRSRVLPGAARVIDQADYSGMKTGVVQLRGKDIVATIEDGELTAVESGGKKFSLANGPRVVGNQATLKHISWQLCDDGWLRCQYSYDAAGTNDFFGVVFDYPEHLVKSKQWFGDGPYRVWKNRRQGVTPGIWQNDYNDTITGWRDWVYPEFKGCFARVRWLRLETSEGQITVVNESGVPFMQVLTPRFPPEKLAGHTIPILPGCGLGFLDAIPPIGSKFQAAEVVSPSGERALAQGDYSGSVSFYFGDSSGKGP